ncbi:type II toxin-antitoxin system RatA family toxin [Xanthomonadaceae bacterium JHOS43]|nr:type II toxin-antitoxin system RatA family toxin [Xanthomonadaceae bacterium JHOS43]MCX7564212.1 type II toxin-antitoxin system RatA family toxin [Xanthomonadaceae bacterium XH05]
MTQIHRSALVARPAPLMFSLVNDVAAYPRRFDWCEAAQVLERDAALQVARLDLRMGGLRTSFTTRNRLFPDERIEMALVDGPFRALTGLWRFTPLGEAGSKVELMMDFEVAGKLVGSALAVGFQRLADRMVGDFVRAAGSVA